MRMYPDGMLIDQYNDSDGMWDEVARIEIEHPTPTFTETTPGYVEAYRVARRAAYQLANTRPLVRRIRERFPDNHTMILWAAEKGWERDYIYWYNEDQR